MRRSLRLILPVFLALGAACGDGGFAPRLFMALEVSPTAFALFTVPPGNTLQLTILAYDQTGATLPFTSGATYSSNAPAIAGVSNSGVVTAAAPGTAKITAALTPGGETRTA
ncbi:MAG TPA: Ig-like domain-containing protein, partial [Gemmatimonadales bacterium]|nr:Ig-like domain-containing protein [Gemmatimonadales bacterium]